MWTELPQDVLVRIFMCLNMLDVVVGAAHTCRAWRSACKNPTLWKTIDLSMANPIYTDATTSRYAWPDKPLPVRYQYWGVLKCALKLSCGAVSCLIFHFSVIAAPEDLIYAAMRTPNVKILVLPGLYERNMEGFVEAVKYWKHLEYITVSCVREYVLFAKVLADNCKSLSHLKLVCSLVPSFAKAICGHLPGLKALSLRYTLVYREALMDVLMNLGGLEVLNLRHVRALELVERGGKRWIEERQRVPGEVAALAKKKKLRVFVTCQNTPCLKCNRPEDNPEGVVLWDEERNWRYDEVPDFLV